MVQLGIDISLNIYNGVQTSLLPAGGGEQGVATGVSIPAGGCERDGWLCGGKAWHLCPLGPAGRAL